MEDGRGANLPTEVEMCGHGRQSYFLDDQHHGAQGSGISAPPAFERAQSHRINQAHAAAARAAVAVSN